MNADTQFTDHLITDVRSVDTGWYLSFDRLGIFCPMDECAEAPVVGETARLYGNGCSVRGIVIDARVYYYRTEEQEEERHANWVADKHRADQEKFERERPMRDARREALPEALRERLSVYETRNPDWRRDYEGYELFVCEEAAAMAAHFAGDFEALRAFAEKTVGEQKQALPSLKWDEHSGNTWGAAVSLAARLVRDPASVRDAHGALCPLVGCVAYGCPGADREEK
jgi:hypothetical protein